MKPERQGLKMNLPNLLSLLRITLAPCFLYFYFSGNGGDEYLFCAIAGGILVLSGITDWLDGFIARKYNTITELGKFLDPFADKLTQAVVCVSISLKYPIFAFVLIPFFAKEIASLIAGIIFIKNKINLPPSKITGKLSTAAFYILTIVLVFFPNPPKLLIYICSGIIILLILITLASYLPVYFKIRKEAATVEETAVPEDAEINS